MEASRLIHSDQGVQLWAGAPCVDHFKQVSDSDDAIGVDIGETQGITLITQRSGVLWLISKIVEAKGGVAVARGDHHSGPPV